MNTVKQSDGPQGFGLRQPSAALGSRRALEGGRGLPHSKAPSRGTDFRGGQEQISTA
jgi:hypothetical protein